MTLKEIQIKKEQLQMYKSKLHKEYEKAKENYNITVNSLLEMPSMEEAIEEAYNRYQESYRKLSEISKKMSFIDALQEKLAELQQKKLAERRQLEGRILWLKAQIQEQERTINQLKNNLPPDRVSKAANDEKIRIAQEQLHKWKEQLMEAERQLEDWKEGEINA